MREELKYNLEKDFPRKDVLFIDFMPTFMDNKLMNRISNYIANFIGDNKVDYIVVPESRGFILGSYLANKIGANVLPIRKKGKIPNKFVGNSYTYQTEYSEETLEIPKIDLKDKNCFFIDDVYALGGTYYACKRLVELSYGNIIGGLCLYNVGINNNPDVFCMMDRKDIKGEDCE